MEQPENIRVHYREMLLRLRRIRNICNRVKNSTKEEEVHYTYLRSSERRILAKEMPLIGVQLKDLLERSDKLGLILYSTTQHFGINMGMFDKPVCITENVWSFLRARATYLYNIGIIDHNRYQEYVDDLWDMLELSPSQFSGRLMLLKLRLN